MSSEIKSYQERDEICQTIINDVDPNRIREYLKYLSEEPHISGTNRDIHLATYIRDLWQNQGLDDVELVPYKVLLSYPDPDQPNQVSIINEDGGIVYSARRQEAALEGQATMQPFNAYSPKGNVMAEPVYANFGRNEDFDYLENLGIKVSGKICIIRYGKIYRGSKVANSAKRGAVGVVLFLCPSHVSAGGTDPQHVYPHTWWMPGDAIQRGDIREEKGDPQTPGYPSIEGAYRIPIDEIDTFPKIPCQPICYDDAIVILRRIAGSSAPDEWTVENGINLGPGFKENEEKLNLIVNNRLQQAVCYNVIGSLKGAVEPDRYVLLGNHRDAWVYGAADPSSGTAQMLEVSRVFGSLAKKGWRPNRTIMFCSWGGEEFGLIGSTEWIEENIHSLKARAVAYINVDICVAGDVFHPEACAMLEDVVIEAAKMVPDPKQQERCLYDVWKETTREKQIHPLGPGTDHVPFYFYAGISSINLSWLVDTEKYPNLFLHPAYHTAYDNFDMIDRFIDPGFYTHQACARICGLLLHRLANSPLLPHSICHLADKIANSWFTLRQRINDRLQQLELRLDYLEDAIAEYQVAAREWRKQLDAIGCDRNNQLSLRRFNDEAMLTERIFLRPEVKSIFRHLIFSPYQDGFSTLSNKLAEGRQEKNRQFLEKYISGVLIATKAATKFICHSKFPFS